VWMHEQGGNYDVIDRLAGAWAYSCSHMLRGDLRTERSWPSCLKLSFSRRGAEVVGEEVALAKARLSCSGKHDAQEISLRFFATAAEKNTAASRGLVTCRKLGRRRSGERGTTRPLAIKTMSVMWWLLPVRRGVSHIVLRDGGESGGGSSMFPDCRTHIVAQQRLGRFAASKQNWSLRGSQEVGRENVVSRKLRRIISTEIH